MFEKFKDYLYYLLPSPFKRIKKELNQWYIFLSVIGDEFDAVQAALERALDETAVATCSDMMLPYYALDRDMYRYPGETNDMFRARIAMRDKIEELGGTRQAILLAASTLGFADAEHIWYPDMGEPDKWAHFLLQVVVKDDDPHPVSHEMLVSEIRKVKDSTSLDNYNYCNVIDSRVYAGAAVAVKNCITIGDNV